LTLVLAPEFTSSVLVAAVFCFVSRTFWLVQRTSISIRSHLFLFGKPQVSETPCIPFE
jgi:hypothetical protein